MPTPPPNWILSREAVLRVEDEFARAERIAPGTVEMSRVDNANNDSIDYRVTVNFAATINTELQRLAVQGGGTYTIPPGVYYLNEPIRQPPNTHIRGDGAPLHCAPGPVFTAVGPRGGNSSIAGVTIVGASEGVRCRNPRSASEELRRWQNAVRLADSDGLDARNRLDSWRDPPGRWRIPRPTAGAEMALPPDGHEPEDL